VRADRLVAILLLLQARGQVTAAEVAAELEVSERTARRDLDALGMAGIPVYSQQGRNGGWQLAGGGRTDLSGLTAAEARALFLVAGPSSSATPQVRAALRKLLRALPEPLRSGAEAASTAVVVDPTGWDQAAPHRPPPPHLDAVQRAVIEGEQVVLGYVARDRAASTRPVHPLGLAAKGSVWYLVADTDAGLRTFRVDRVTSIDPTGKPVVRPVPGVLPGDHPGGWSSDGRHLYVFTDLQIPPTISDVRVRIGPAGPDGRVEVELRGHHVRSLGGEVAGLGAALEIVDPPELREHLARLGQELSAAYTD